MRLFLAINLPSAIRARIAAATLPLRDAIPDVRWTAEDKLHLTLKFLGEQDESRLDDIRAAVASVANRHAPSEADIGGVGAFPSARRPRVIWIGVDRTPRLELLAHDLEEACEKIGFEPEGRAFRPHITLGRIRERPAADDVRSLARASKRVAFDGSLPILSLDLMRSDPNGAAYHLMSSAPLSRGER